MEHQSTNCAISANAMEVMAMLEHLSASPGGHTAETITKYPVVKTDTSCEVADVLVQAAQLDPEFPERLSGGFVERYRRAKGEGLSGDDIFTELYDWAGGGGTDKAREAAGLCIIAHLFIICDLFEK